MPCFFSHIVYDEPFLISNNQLNNNNKKNQLELLELDMEQQTESK